MFAQLNKLRCVAVAFEEDAGFAVETEQREAGKVVRAYEGRGRAIPHLPHLHQINFAVEHRVIAIESMRRADSRRTAVTEMNVQSASRDPERDQAIKRIARPPSTGADDKMFEFPWRGFQG